MRSWRWTSWSTSRSTAAGSLSSRRHAMRATSLSCSSRLALEHPSAWMPASSTRHSSPRKGFCLLILSLWTSVMARRLLRYLRSWEYSKSSHWKVASSRLTFQIQLDISVSSWSRNWYSSSLSSKHRLLFWKRLITSMVLVCPAQ